jgi:hypothetical protein
VFELAEGVELTTSAVEEFMLVAFAEAKLEEELLASE